MNNLFVSFNLLAFLGWLALSSAIPGAILSFSIFRKDDLNFIEKLLIGFALGIIIPPLVPFLLYLGAGVKYSYGVALAGVAFLYLAALAFFVKSRAYEEALAFVQKKGEPATGKIVISQGMVLQGILALILLLAYLSRVGTYSPVFQELDPYFYTYPAHQLLTLGENPFDDQTSWYPEVVVNHRIIPEISYLESLWYSLYTGGGAYDNMLLAVIASMYPPVVAILAVFSVYLIFSALGRREWGVVAAGITAFIPIFIYKLSAGEQEMQPYGFFALLFFYACYVLAMKRQELRFPVLAGLAFAALSLGSASQIVAVISVLIFTGVQSTLLFLREDDTSALKWLLVSNAIIFVIGPVVGSMLLKDIFTTGSPSFSIVIPYGLALAVAGALYAIREKVPDKALSTQVLGALFLVGLLVYAFTPLGAHVKSMGQSAFGLAAYNAPLDRTIAEQGVASDVFGAQVGFVAEMYNDVAATLLMPIASPLKSSSPKLADDLVNLATTLLSVIFMVFSVLANVGIAIFVGMVNTVLGTDVAFTQKANSLLLFWVFMFWAALAYCAWCFSRKEDDQLFVLFGAMVMPPLIVGLLKAKYTIYAGVLLAIAIGFVLVTAERAMGGAFRKFFRDEEQFRKAGTYLMVFGGILVVAQFAYQGLAPSLAWGSLQTLYQNDPAALAAKFQVFCAAHPENTVLCSAAADPAGYASRGTNYQYNTQLCYLSVFSDYAYLQGVPPPSWEAITAQFRCQRISEYWIDSMEWIRDSTEPGARVTSWWDYGHWINYFGLRNAVLRNEHASQKMIGEVAHNYLDGTPEELRAWMKAHDSKYALFDMELISGGSQLGGKYGALNYLSCARDNETTVAQSPGESQCEARHLWESILVSSMPCTISQLTNKSGVMAYKVYIGTSAEQAYLPYYPDICADPQDQNVIAYCKNYVHVVPAYCVGEVTLASGEKTYATYYLNQTYANGDLMLNKALLQLPVEVRTSHIGTTTGVTLFYTNDRIWLENGEVKSGYEDRKGKFYESNLYRALFLNEIPGFRHVYSTPDGAVKIYAVEG